MVNKKSIIITIIISIILLGFILGLVVKPFPTICTAMWCSPQENSTGIVEIPCNGCGIVDPVFLTGILNVYKSCSTQEILIFSDQEYIETRYSEFSRCKYKIGFFLLFR
jgi:hypothetical protein